MTLHELPRPLLEALKRRLETKQYLHAAIAQGDQAQARALEMSLAEVDMLLQQHGMAPPPL